MKLSKFKDHMPCHSLFDARDVHAKQIAFTQKSGFVYLRR